MNRFGIMRLLAILLLFFIGFEILVLAVLYNVKKTLIKPAFVDALDSSGIKRESHASGAAWADYDNDGYLDLLIAGNKTRLYRNKGDGTFMDTAEKAGILSEPTMSGVFGDYDNDGCKDVYFVGHGPRQDRLFHSNCKGGFIDVTHTSGIKNELYIGHGMAWADYDADGYLDFYVANYGVNPSKKEHLSQPNILYHNNRDGTFSDATEEASVSGATLCGIESPFIRLNKVIGGPYKQSYQPVWFDYNSDGYIDLFIATDAGVSPLYKNNGDGTFTEVTKAAGLCRLGTGMGAAVGDYDNNGHLDLYVTNIGSNYFWRNNGDDTFSEIASDTGTADHTSIGWGTDFFDYDNDGHLDLYVVNGTALGEEDDPDVGKIREDKLYKNNGDGAFMEVGLKEGIVGDYAKEGAAFGDYNNDGFIDSYVVSSNLFYTSNDRLYQNQPNGNHWLTLQLKGTKSNRDAIGARITVKAGGKKQMREVNAGSSFISQNSLWQTFGLGEAKIIDAIEIRWPSGIKQVLRNRRTDQKIIVSEKGP